MDNPNKINFSREKLINAAAIIVVFIIAIVLVIKSQERPPINAVEQINDGYLVAGAPTPAEIETKKNSYNATIASGKPTYEEMIAQYSGRRMLIKDCQATPYNVTFKNGTTILLDGFSEDVQTITIGNKSVKLNGYALATITLDGNSDKSTQTVNCHYSRGDRYNIATILLQP